MLLADGMSFRDVVTQRIEAFRPIAARAQVAGVTRRDIDKIDLAIARAADGLVLSLGLPVLATWMVPP